MIVIIIIALVGWAFNGWFYYEYEDFHETKGWLGVIVRIVAIIPFSYMIVLATMMIGCLLALLIGAVISCFYQAFCGVAMLLRNKKDCS